MAVCEAPSPVEAVCLAGDDHLLRRLLDTRGLAHSEPRPQPRQAAGPVAVLVVEDDPDMRSALVDMLAPAGYEVASAEDGVRGLERFTAGHFDVLVTDLAMPRMNGLELARRCREHQPSVAIVMVTAWGALVTDDDGAAHGVDVVLMKPLRVSTLLDAVRDAISRRQ